jgi:hypothetical protein
MFWIQASRDLVMGFSAAQATRRSMKTDSSFICGVYPFLSFFFIQNPPKRLARHFGKRRLSSFANGLPNSYHGGEWFCTGCRRHPKGCGLYRFFTAMILPGNNPLEKEGGAYVIDFSM